MKKFKTESQRVLDIMVNSIYTHKEIFLRELLSNASDAIDKLYYKSLQENLGLSHGDFYIRIEPDEKSKILKISDNGIGMNEQELEDNLGVIAKSGSLDFKAAMDKKDEIDIIGQFGVGFYSAFMVSEKVEVLSRAYGSDHAYKWTSKGAEGYAIQSAERDCYGTTVTLYLKPDTEEEKYGEFLSEYKIRELVKKYSDYIRYPIKMQVTKYKPAEDKDKEPVKYLEEETLNSMIPIWKKAKSEIKDEEYNSFYKDTFYDYNDPMKVINTSVEGAVSYKAVLYIPSKAPFNYYMKSYEKGLKLYNGGIMIMEKCADLLPDCFSFVKGVVDSELSLNISRETIQQSYQLKKIAVNLEKKIQSELENMLNSEREKYENFFKEFGLQIKYGIYESFGSKKELIDLLMFRSLKENKPVTLKEYKQKMISDQKYIYYASGKSIDAVKALPQAENIIDSGADILCFSDDIDEFIVKILNEYDKVEFKSVSASDTGSEKEENLTDKDKEILEFIKNSLNNKVEKVKLSTRLKTHPVCLTAEGDLSIEMEKVFNQLPNAANVSAKKILEINAGHPIYNKIKTLYDQDKDTLKDYANILLVQAKLIEGLPIDNPSEYSDLVCRKLSG